MDWAKIAALQKKAQARQMAVVSVPMNDDGDLELALFTVVPDGSRGRFAEKLAVGVAAIVEILEEG